MIRQTSKLLSVVILTLTLTVFWMPCAHALLFKSSTGSNSTSSWDAILHCTIVSGTTDIGNDLTTSITGGQYYCTFTDTTNNFEEGAYCTLRIEYTGLTPSCLSGDDHTVNISGLASTKQNPDRAAVVMSYIDCSAATNNPGGINPPFCTYAGTDPNGFPAGAGNGPCKLNLGIANANGSLLTRNDAETVFGSPPTIYQLPITFQNSLSCGSTTDVVNSVNNNPISNLGHILNDYCHADTWDPSIAAFCDVAHGSAKNTGDATVVNGLVADYAITNKTTLNSVCNNTPSSNDNLQFSIYAQPQDPNAGANNIDVNQIMTAFTNPSGDVTINGRVADCSSGVNYDSTLMTEKLDCSVPRCDANGVNIASSILPDSDNDGKPETVLILAAQLIDGTQIEGAEKINISNNETPQISISDISLVEGDSGSTPFTFIATSSGGGGTVTYTTIDGGTAEAGVDYQSKSGSISFANGETSKEITIDVNGDTVIEPNESFKVQLTVDPSKAQLADDGIGVGTIINDDTATISIDDVSKSEGNSGTTDFDFTVSITKPISTGVNLKYQTKDGTAKVSKGDYAASSGTVTIDADTTMATIRVQVFGDTSKERDEMFSVVLTGFDGTPPIGVSITDDTGVGTIGNDD